LTGDQRDPLTDALLFNAARAELVRTVIAPALERASVVICDRYADSTLAYQGYGAGLPLDDLRAMIRIATDGLVPDRTVLFDLPAEAALRRRDAGSESEFTRFESKEQHDLAFHERVLDGYRTLAGAETMRWRIVNGGQHPRLVAEEVWKAVADLF